MLADLDHFKAYNDNHGHAAGDGLLRTFGASLRQAARTTDITCRLGGDEFAVILSNCPGLDAAAFNERVHTTWTASQPAEFGVSLGYASLEDAASPEHAFELADTAMYTAKNAKHPTAATRRPPNSTAVTEPSRKTGHSRHPPGPRSRRA